MTESKLVETIKEYLEESQADNANWRSTALRARQFYLGQQWNSEDRQKLESEGRPALTINRILPTVNMLSGYQRQNRPDFKVFPRNGGLTSVAAVLTALAKHAMDRANADWEISAMFLDGLITGKGFVAFDIDYAQDPINGELIVRKLHPLDVFEDRRSLHYDLNQGARYVIRQYRQTREELELLFPGKARTLRAAERTGELSPWVNAEQNTETTTADYHGANDDRDLPGLLHHDRRLVVYECWQRPLVKTDFLIDRVNLEVFALDPKRIKGEKVSQLADMYRSYRNQQAIPELLRILQRSEKAVPLELAALIAGSDGQRWVIRERVVPQLRCTTVVNNVVLDDRIDPFHGLNMYPIVRFSPFHLDEDIMGIVENLISPQEEHNKRRSQFLHQINISANSLWRVEDGAMSEPELANLRDFGSKAGTVITHRRGYSIERINPSAMPMGYLQLSEASATDIKDISGANSDLLGHKSERVESGRAMMLRHRQGLIVNEILFDNFNYSLQIFGTTLVELIRRGSSERLSYLYSDNEIRAILGEQNIDVDLNTIRSLATGTYGIKVAQSSKLPTARLANFEALLEAVRAGLPIHPKYIIEASDLPNKKEIIADLERSQQAAQTGPVQAPGTMLPSKPNPASPLDNL